MKRCRLRNGKLIASDSSCETRTWSRTRCWNGRIVTACLFKRPRRLARPRTSPFHGGNTGSNPVGDAKPFQDLPSNAPIPQRHKKAQLRAEFCKPASTITSIYRHFRQFVAGTKRNTQLAHQATRQRMHAAGESLYFELFVSEASLPACTYPMSPGWKRGEVILASP